MERHGHHEARELGRNGLSWEVVGGQEVLAEAPVVILTGAAEAARFSQGAWLPLKRIRGQISCLPANTQSGQLRTVLCAKGYVAPPRNGTHTLGASFNFQQTDDTPSVAEHQANLEMLEQISADLYQRLDRKSTRLNSSH